jgi:hypothetical protein
MVGGARYPSAPPEHWPAYAPMAPGPVPAGSPVPPPEGGGRRSPGALVAVGVAVVLLLVVAGIATLAGSGSDSEETTDTTVDLSDPEITAPPSEDPLEPFGPTMPSIPGFDPGSGVDPEQFAQPLEDVLPDLIEFVEQTRGQQFVTEPVVDAVPEGEFVALLEEAQAGEEEALTKATVTDIALGLIPPDADLADAATQAGSVSVLGFYDQDTDELYVKGDVITPLVQMVIVHELTHALDDQIFDLTRLDDFAERGDESAFGFLALVEGTASYVQDQFRVQLSPDEAAALAQEEIELGFDQMASLFSIPPSFLVESQVPYVSGQRFTQALVDEGGMAEVDAAYQAPPTTSEQILDPAVYLAGEGAVDLQPLESEGAKAEEGAFGAADLRMLDLVADPTSALLDPNVGALEPVEGYGGGQFVSWTEGDLSCVELEAVGDDAAGSETILALLETWADAAPGGEVGTRPGGNGVTVITAERCG